MKKTICIIGLGYVGLPLAVEFGKKYKTIGYDIDQNRIDQLNRKIDRTLECNADELAHAKYLSFTNNPNNIKKANFYIVTVPTPIDSHNKPNLQPLESASNLVGKVINKGDFVIFESTVFPGATEEFCVPVIEKLSGLKLNQDFFCGYSPERINPGDKNHRLTTIQKVTSGSNRYAAKIIDALYGTIIEAGTFQAQSIKVAEAAKVIENTQRDLNIALMNELSLIFQKLGIDTKQVVEAASTKWNFIPFMPGLVGGHCIGVDPYYLTYKAEEIGYLPEVILSGRRLNDSMAHNFGEMVLKKIIKNKVDPSSCKILICGITFKENCPDIRNTKVLDLYNYLKDFNSNIDIYDPWVDSIEAKKIFKKAPLKKLVKRNQYDVIILAVGHSQFLVDGFLETISNKKSIVADLKSLLPINKSHIRL